MLVDDEVVHITQQQFDLVDYEVEEEELHQIHQRQMVLLIHEVEEDEDGEVVMVLSIHLDELVEAE